MYDLDFTTLYSQPSERYERVLRHKKKEIKKKYFSKNNNNRRSSYFQSFIEIGTENYTTKDNFFNNTCWFQNKFSVLF